MKNNYIKYTDEQLVDLAKAGDLSGEEELLTRYKSLISHICKSYYLVGGEHEDILQEAMIGLVKAIRTYEKNSEASFKTYATICVNRQVITAIKAANRKKHLPLNTSISLDTIVLEDGEKSVEIPLVDTIEGKVISDPETLAVFKDIVDYINNNQSGAFSDFEIEVWNRYTENRDYNDIAHALNKDAKSIYNAMDRIKKKIAKFME